MSSVEWPDLSCLASLARDQKLDVRPVLLRVHTDLFAAAPSRDRDTIEAFEALALGFLPVVDDPTAALVAHKLACIADTPPAIIDALVRRGGEVREAILRGSAESERSTDVPIAKNQPEAAIESPTPARALPDYLRVIDEEESALAWARDSQAHLSASQLHELVDRARERPQLAMALLGRGDLGPGDEAVLYLHANDVQRTRIRSRLEPLVALAGHRSVLARTDDRAITSLLEFAKALDISGFETQLAEMLHLVPVPAWSFQREPRRELLALALVAAGVRAEDCARVFLTLHPAISRSVRTVFHLTHIARSVSRPIALYLVEAILGAAVEAKHEGRHIPVADPSTVPVRDRARRPTLTQIRAAVLARRTG